MRSGLVTVALTVPMALLGCGFVSGDDTVEPGRNFTLAPGDDARLKDGDLVVTFKDVTQDSRCPTGVQCVWEGDAVVEVSTTSGGGQPAVHQLHTTIEPTKVTVAGHELRLVSLDPHPRQGQTIAGGDYRAEFMLAAP